MCRINRTLVPLVMALALGVGVGKAEIELVAQGSECQFLVPTVENGGSELTLPDWTGIAPPPNVEQWQTGQIGIGYGGNGELFLPYMEWHLVGEMRSVNPSLFLRVSFELSAGVATE